MFMAFCIVVFYVCLIILVLESPQSCVALMVRKAIVLNQLISSKEWIRPTYYKKIVLEVDHNIYTGFLITMVNKIEMNAETCSVFDNLALMEINSKNISFGCSHYLVHYANSPLIIRIVPSVFSTLNEHIKIVVTGVRLACSPYSLKFRQCPNHELFCVPRSLFCDGVDNCGLEADERDCVEPLANVAISLIDSRTDRYASIITASLAIVSVCVGILMFMVYKWYLKARRGYSSKYVKSVFGNNREPSNCEAGETVTLLTLGLRNMLPHMAQVPRRLSHYQSIRIGTVF